VGEYFFDILIEKINTESANPGFIGRDIKGNKHYYKFDSTSYETVISKKLSASPFVMKALPISYDHFPRIIFLRKSGEKLVPLGMSKYYLMKFNAMKNGDLLHLIIRS
jgi:hypothetical protein